MARSQSSKLDRKKFFGDPVLVVTIIALITFLSLFILYPLAMLLTDSVMVRETKLYSIEPLVNGQEIEYALSPECVELADDAESYQYLVITNAEEPAALAAFPELDRNKTIEYDFADAKENTSKYVEDYFNALKEAGNEADDRFKTE